MLRTFLDRVFPLTLVYAALIYLSWTAKHYTTDLTSSILFLLSTTWYLFKVVFHLTEERKISSLGTHAPQMRTFTPFNIGFLFQALWYFSHHRNHELWWKLFRKAGEGRYTVEAVTVGSRIVFTADEENVKAILATQFGEYGKGEQFRKEWRDFLGLSEYRVPLLEGVCVRKGRR